MFQNYKASTTDADKEFKMVKVRFIKDEWDRLSCNSYYFITMVLFNEIFSTVNAKVNYLQILLDVKFIFMLLDFAKRSIPLREEIENIGKSPQQSLQPARQQRTTSSNEISVNIDFVLNEPRIALLEDAADHNSRVILVKVLDICNKITLVFPFEQFYCF